MKMFVGHYGVSFAAKAIKPAIPLWLLFIAVQLVDVFWAIFVLLGIEKVRIVPGITATNPLDLYYMPYTHGLAATFVWMLLALMLYRFVPRLHHWTLAAVVAIAVGSHWVLDLLVHRPDLPLYGNLHKVGLGLWNYPVIAFLLEVTFLFGGLILYLRSTTPLNRTGRFGFWVFGLVMLLIQLMVFFGAPPPSDTAAAISALVSYFVFALIIFWLEKQRAPLKSAESAEEAASLVG